jgi:hypothetical protein
MKFVAMVLGAGAGFVSVFYLGLYEALLGGFSTGIPGVSGVTWHLIQLLLVSVSIIGLAGGVLVGIKPKIGGALLIISAVGHASLLGLGPFGLSFAVSFAVAGLLGLLARQRDASGIELVIVYLGLMVGGVYLAYLTGATFERYAPTSGLTVFLTLYFLFFWIAWVLAVPLIKPRPEARTASP